MLIRLLRSTSFLVLLLAATTTFAVEQYLSGITWEEPPKVDPGETDDSPPSDATVLFDGTDLSAWQGDWQIEEGAMVNRSGNIQTKEEFGDCQLHLEWSSPKPPKGKGQQRGNSGVFLMGRYEVQVLDSYNSKTYPDGQAASVYKDTPPMVNAMRPPGEWNTYDIFWTAPRFSEDGEVTSPAKVTVVHNGVLVVLNHEVKGNTYYDKPHFYTPHGPKGPISLQDHGQKVRFRNIWVREIEPPAGERTSEPNMTLGENNEIIRRGAQHEGDE